MSAISNGNILINTTGAGKVGIRNASPVYTFDVIGTIGASVSTHTPHVYTNNVTSDGVLTISGSGYNILLSTSGNVAIGGADPQRKLDITGTLRASDYAEFGNYVIINQHLRVGSYMSITGSITPGADDVHDLGSATNRWANVYAVKTKTGGFYETGLTTKNLGKHKTGTVVVWRYTSLTPCDSNADKLVMGVVSETDDEPIILGVEPILVTGKVEEGDFLITSNVVGHAKAAPKLS